MRKIIYILFAILFFFVPLVLWPYTSEVFEFNKMIVVYVLTTLIATAWISKSILERKVIFRRTILDKPLLIFLGSQLISTVLSIDPQTSTLGYYSRFNGGFVSTLCYSLLYWAFVSNSKKEDVLKLINYSLFPSALLVSLYGVAEHFGIDKNLWVQDVQSRVFSTLGQPNWLAAYLVALLPITWGLALKEHFQKRQFWIYFLLSTLFFWTLIFTKSRSGLLGFAVAFIIFWGYYFWSNRKEYKTNLSAFVLISSSIFVIGLISGTQFTPSLSQMLRQQSTVNVAPAGPALETGGTESGTIRKIVWKGAVDIWAHYPVFGTGVETFAYSYYLYRPSAHNLVSEWDFIYNKAHNEYLNFMANTGTVGIAAYLALIGYSLYAFIKRLVKSEHGFIILAFLSGYTSILVTNFFGFSVVPTQLMLFLFPAFGIVLSTEYAVPSTNKTKISNYPKFAVALVLCTAFFVLWRIATYWRADILYNLGKNYNSVGNYVLAKNYLAAAASLTPSQGLFHNDLATSYVNMATSANQQKNTEEYKRLSKLAIAESDKAVNLSTANLNFKRTRFGVFIILSAIEPNYLINARDTLIEAIKQAPTDAKIYYNLGLTYTRTNEPDLAISALKRTIELKEDYRDARLAYAYLLIEKKDFVEAKNQLEYILKNIDPADSLAKQALEEIR